MFSAALNRLFLCSVLALLFAPQNALAGRITSVDSVTGGGTATVNPIITTTDNNDNATAFGGNLLVAGKVIDSGVPIDIVLNTADTDGTTEYYVAEGVTNNTGSPILGYQFQLGFGSALSFVPSIVGDGLDFDTPDKDPVPTSGQFASLVHDQDLLNFFNGIIGDGLTDAITLSIDVPDLIGDQFTLRQTALVPEPGTLSLTVTALLALTVLGVRRRRD
jgi:hypothetical protein